MLLASHQNTKKSHDIKLTNRLFENVAQVIYFGITEINSMELRTTPEAMSCAATHSISWNPKVY
jgi:hypothetical protein